MVRRLCADDRQSGKDILQVKHTLQDSLDQISNWCDNNSMVMNQKKIYSMSLTRKPEHNLSPLSVDLMLRGLKIEQVS